MNKRVLKVGISLLLAVVDLGLFLLCEIIAILIIEPSSLHFSMVGRFFLVSSLLILITYMSTGMYSFKTHVFWEELQSIARLGFYCLLMALFWKLLFPGSLRIRTFFIIYASFISLDTLVRYFFRRIPGISAVLATHVTMIGTGKRCRSMITRMKASKFSLYDIRFAITEDDTVTTPDVLGVPIVGTLEDLNHLMETYPCDEVVVCLNSYDRKQISAIVSTMIRYVKVIKYVPEVGTLINYSSTIKDINGIMVLSSNFLNIGIGAKVFKRLTDICIGLIGLILFLPVLLVVSIAIFFEDRGSVFFRQKRVGKNGKLFTMWKFRTMVNDAEGVLQDMLNKDSTMKKQYSKHHKLHRDPRVTRVGRFLRKTSLDEIPQVINLIKGDMSFVGPRPYLQREIPQMGNSYPVIIQVTPGVSGLWQVSGRSDLSFADRVALDSFYVYNHSWWNDIIIMLKTARVVFSKMGAR